MKTGTKVFMGILLVGIALSACSFFDKPTDLRATIFSMMILACLHVWTVMYYRQEREKILARSKVRQLAFEAMLRENGWDK